MGIYIISTLKTLKFMICHTKMQLFSKKIIVSKKAYCDKTYSTKYNFV